MAAYIPALILLLLVGASLIIARTNNLFSVAFLAGISSLLVASLYMVLEAPDVAFTEAAVGAGVSTVLFLVTISVIGEQHAYTAVKKIPSLALALVLGGLVYYSMLDLPKLSDADLALHAHVAHYYLAHSMHDIGIDNVVTSVLASYRGMDTLGETAVIFTAGIGVLIVLGGRGNKRNKP